MSKIKKIKIKNVLGIKEFEYDAGKINFIDGHTGSGKTSIIEAIEKAFTNNDRRVDIIHKDEDKAEILINLDDNLEIRRRITDKGNYIDIKRDGEKIDDEFGEGIGPQTFLNSLYGKYSFNPIDFLSEDEKTQKKLLLKCIEVNVGKDEIFKWIGKYLENIEDIDIDFEKIDWEKHELEIIDNLKGEFYEERRVKNKERKNIKAKYKTEMEKIPNNFDPEEYRDKSLRDEYNKLQKVQDKNKKIDKAKVVVDKIESKIESYDRDKKEIEQNSKNEIEKIEIQIKQLKEKIGKIKNNTKQNKNQIDKNIEELKDKQNKMKAFLQKYDKTDTEKLEKEIEQFEEKKELVRAYDRALDKKREYKTINKEWKSLDNIVDILRSKPQEILKDAKLPIDDLRIENGEFIVNDVYLGNLSSGEEIKFATKIAKSTAGDLKVICIDGIERLDEDTKKQFYKEIKDDEFQYFITEVSRGNLHVSKEGKI